MEDPLTRQIRFPPIQLADLVVPLEDCSMLDEGPVALRAIDDLVARDFSQAVVRGSGPDHGYGVVTVDRLRELNRDGQPLSINDAGVDRSLLRCEGAQGYRRQLHIDEQVWAIRDSRPSASRRLRVMHPEASLTLVLEALSCRSASLVGCCEPDLGPWADEPDEGEDTQQDEKPDIVGLITLADLNKHPLRAAVYPILAQLEGLLAALVERRFNADPWQWIMRLTNEESRARIVGYWKLSQREGVNVGATAGATLSELLRAVACVDDLRGGLGFASREAFSEATHHLHRFRNLTMHPVRPLISSPADCHDLKHALTAAIEISQRVPLVHLSLEIADD